jgi:type II secretory ATPase GspE/PulE/Tfp pilus assembly ATPase PilB-like protein
LDKRKGLLSLFELGLSDSDLAIFKKLSRTRNGLILATGPTGSGKSTTLYAFINAIDRVDKNIITIEDPVEYEIEGTVQSNVNTKVGLTFAEALKAILRQDPDIIYVGEIRDAETAEITVRAALTGHLVLSTLHTNDAAGAIVRLHEMGISRELIQSVLKCSFAQRLVRKICPRCKQVDHPKDYLTQQLGASANSTYYKGTGCDYCDHSGYRGMTAIYEIFLVDKKIGAMIVENVSDREVRQAAEKSGMQSLSQQGVLMAQKGITTLEEVARVIAGS